MIDLYTWATPNGRKVSIALEELGLEYTVYPINIAEGEQFSADFTAISPNQKIPAIVDQETGITLMESGAILMYLAEKAGHKLLPRDPGRYWNTIQWRMWQKSAFGPMLGLALHYLDSLDSKMHTFTQLMSEDANSDSTWTTYHPSLGRKIFKGQANQP